MEVWQKILIIGWGVLGLIGSIEGYIRCRYKRNNLSYDGIFFIYGAFVWADIVIFGIFWAAVSVFIILTNDWILFPLTLSIFWLVRSVGETIYWFNQQFSTVIRCSFKDDHWLIKIFGNNYTVWFVFQICMQCITVISLILSIHFVKLWLG
jgi:hypothetical protein